MINKERRVFNQQEIDALLPLINRVTAKARKAVNQLQNELLSASHRGGDQKFVLERQIDREIELWMSKLRLLGAYPKGPWNADFDHGFGYFCWRYPEAKIMYSHGYQEGFAGRRPITNEANLENSHSPNQPDPR